MGYTTETPFGSYTPQPLDTSDIELPRELEALREQVAEQVHDIWAEGRMRDGWTWGPVRDDAEQHNPTLIPYEDLSNSEREYDRNTAEGTLKMLLKLGWKITPPEQ